MNNTQKLDNIRRRLRTIETRLGVIQRANVVMFERITGGAFPPDWIVNDRERKLLAGDES